MRRFLAVLWTVGFASGVPAHATASNWELQLPGMSQHFEKPRKRGAEWNQYHEGMGLQRTIDVDRNRLDGGWVLRYSGGFMLDSYGNESGYLGAGLAWRRRSTIFDVDAGVAPMLLYRTTRFDDPRRGPAPLRLIPAMLPTLSVEHRQSGIGANIILVPAMDLGRDFRMPGLAFVQFTRKLE